MSLETGHIIDRYVVEGLLGQGAMAQVYRVRHRELGSDHALKVLLVNTPRLEERLLREGRAQSQLRHPNVVPVTDVVRFEGRVGLVMEFIAGPTLEAWLSRHRPDPDQIDVLARGLLDGVAAAHGLGIVHRDLKPANILLQVTPRRLVPKVTDFGLAKVLLEERTDLFATREGTILGTPAYMAPEQTRDSSTVDARADVFACGCILYEMLCRRTPYEAPNIFELFELAQAGNYKDPALLAPWAPDRMLKAIRAALQPDPQARPADALALADLWREGVAGTGNFQAAVLDSARQMGSTAERAPSTPTWAEASAKATPPPPPPMPGPPPLSRRSFPWKWLPVGILIGFAGVMCVGAGTAVTGSWSTEAPPSRPGAVRLEFDDPALQRQLELAYDELSKAQFTQAHQRAKALLAADPLDPSAALIEASARFYVFDGSTARVIDADYPLPEDDSDPDLLFARIHHRAFREQGFDRVQAFRLHFERHPDHWIGYLVAGQISRGIDLDQSLAWFRQAQALNPEGIIEYVLISETLPPEEAELAAQLRAEGLRRDPLSVPLLRKEAESLRRTDPKKSREILIQALGIAPGHPELKVDLALLDLAAGDTQTLETVVAEFASAGTAESQQIRLAREALSQLRNDGRPREALLWADRLIALLHRNHRYGEAIIERLNAMLERTTVREGVEAELAQLRLDSTNPELQAELRDNIAHNILLVDALSAVRRGDLADAEATAARFAAMPGEESNVAWIRRSIALARRDLAAFEEGLALGTSTSCGRYHDAMEGYEALEAWDRVLTTAAAWEADRCDTQGPTFRQLWRVHKAQACAATGDSACVVEMDRQFRAEWPRVESDHPLLVSLEGLR